MPLSEHEQRLLEQIERALYADDKFASSVRSSNPRTYLLRRVRRGVALFVLGLLVLVLAVSINKNPLTLLLGVGGFLLMLFAALRGASDLRRISGRVEPRRRGPRPATTGKAKRQTSFMDRVEERWRRRWEERGGR